MSNAVGWSTYPSVVTASCFEAFVRVRVVGAFILFNLIMEVGPPIVFMPPTDIVPFELLALPIVQTKSAIFATPSTVKVFTSVFRRIRASCWRDMVLRLPFTVNELT